MEERIFIDPTPITPYELTVNEMGQIYGGVAEMLAPGVVIWVAECSYGLAGVVTGAVLAIGGD